MTESNATARWYAVHTKPHAERQVEGTCLQRNVEAYLPAKQVKARRGRSPLQPYFPCYLFAGADLDAIGRWTLQYMPGVRGLVMFGGNPAVVDDCLIAQIRERLANPEAVGERGDLLTHGDRVEIFEEPFKDIQPVFDRRLSAEGRVQVLLQLIREQNRGEQWRKLDVDAQVLRKIR